MATGGAGLADSIGSGRAFCGGVRVRVTGGAGLADSIGSSRAFRGGVLIRATGGAGISHNIGSGRACCGGVLIRATYSTLFALASRKVFTPPACWRLRCWLLLLLSKQRSPVSDLKRMLVRQEQRSLFCVYLSKYSRLLTFQNGLPL